MYQQSLEVPLAVEGTIKCVILFLTTVFCIKKKK